MEVIVTGRVTTYPGRSQYQIIIETLAPAGVGALLAQFERLKTKLAAALWEAGEERIVCVRLAERVSRVADRPVPRAPAQVAAERMQVKAVRPVLMLARA